MAELTKVLSREQILDVVELACKIWTEHYVPIIGQEQVDYMLAKFQSEDAVKTQISEGYEYYTVAHNGKNAGYMAILPDAEAGSCMISKIYVLGTDRGQGFGRTMLEFAENICRKRRIKKLWLTVNKYNTRSIAWYMKMGFRNMGSIIQDIGGGFVMDDYRLEKSVDR